MTKYSDGYGNRLGIGNVTEQQIAEYIRQNTDKWDRLGYHKASDIYELACLILAGVVKESNGVSDEEDDEWWL